MISAYETQVYASCHNDEETPTKIDRDDDGIDGVWMWGVVLELSMGYIVFTTGKPW